MHKTLFGILKQESQTTLKKNNWIHFDRTTNDLDQVGVTIKQFGGVIEPFIFANTQSIALQCFIDSKPLSIGPVFPESPGDSPDDTGGEASSYSPLSTPALCLL